MMNLPDGLYAVYLRKSRADIEKERYGKFETLAMHEKGLEELARREGLALAQPYYREMVSGEHIADRLEFQKMIRAVEQRRYRGILVYEVSRLGRGDPMEYGWILAILQRTKTLIVTLGRVYDPTADEDIRALKMEMFISNMEFGNIKTRLVNGCESSARCGSFIKPRAPYGYDRYKRPEDGRWSLKPNDDASTVRTIFEKAAAGVPFGSIASQFNDAGMRTQSGGYWSASRVHTIVNNPHYKGVIRYGYWKTETIPEKDFTISRKRVANEKCIYVPGLHEAIVSEELWERANNRAERSAPVKRSKKLKNPLAGLLVCSGCGHPMLRFMNTVKSNGNKIEHLRHPRFTDCASPEPGVKLSVAVDMVCEALEEIVEEISIEPEPEPDDTEAELETLNRKLSEEQRRSGKLLELYYADAISIPEFKERKQASLEIRGQLESRIEELSVAKPTPRQKAASIKKAIRLLRSDSVSADVKNAALKSFVERIEYTNRTPRRSRKYDIHLRIVLKD